MREHSHSAVKDDTDVSGRVGSMNCIISKTKWCQKRYRTELQVRVEVEKVQFCPCLVSVY